MKGIFKKMTAAVIGSAITATAAMGGAVSTFAADNIEYTKTIEGSGDDYMLKLSVTGKDKTEESTNTVTTNGHADIVLVIDETYSMTAALGSTTRMAAVKEAAKSFVNGLSDDSYSNISLVIYQCYDTQSRQTPVTTKVDWVAADASGKSAVSNAINNLSPQNQTYGYDTVYTPALQHTSSVLDEAKVKNDGNNKYVIFFSDGDNSDSGLGLNVSNAAAQVKSKATVFSLGIPVADPWGGMFGGSAYTDPEDLKNIASSTDKYHSITDASAMSSAFNSALTTIKTETVVTKTPMSNVTISDKLSQYVEQNGAATLTASDGSSVNAAINGTSATINGDLKDGVTYTLNIPVKPSQAAKDAANAASTDTSTFKTNDGATLTYSYGSDTQTLDYTELPEITLTKEATDDPVTTDPSDVSFTLTKTLTVNSADKRVPNAAFEFTAEADKANAPAITIGDAAFSESDTIDNDKKVSKDVSFSVPAAADFPAADTYVYTIKETQDTYTGEGDMTYDTTEYKLTVKVCETAGGLTYDDADGGHMTLVKAGDEAKKLDTIEFNNQYSKEVKTAKLEVSKTVEGEHANKDQSFDFTVNFTDPGNVGDVKPVKDGEDIEYGEDCTFTLKDGESVTFTVPIGTTYTVTESGTDSYEASARVTSADTQSDSKAKVGEELKVSAEAVDGENKAAFTNTYVDSPLTGITNGRGPLFIIIPAAAGAVALMAFARKRRRA